MIDRIVLFKLKPDYVSDDARAEIATHARQVLTAIEGVREIRVGVPADPASTKAWDISIITRFDDLAATNAFVESAEHSAFLNDYMAPRMEVVKHWNFEA